MALKSKTMFQVHDLLLFHPLRSGDAEGESRLKLMLLTAFTGKM